MGGTKMQAEQLLSFGPYRFDLGTEQVWRGKQAVKLTPKALVLLRTLATRAGELVTKEELLQAGWPQTAVSDDALTACIQELRRALGDDARQPRYIETVHRRGFRFIGKVISCERPTTRRGEGAGIQNGAPAQLPPIIDTEEPTPPLQPITDIPHPAPALAGRGQRLAQFQAWLGTLRGGWRRGALSLTGLAIIIGIIVLVQNISFKSPRTPASIPPSHPNPQQSGRGAEALALPDKPSIAVLPFTNMSGDREQEYFSDGITDDLITDLSRLPGLFVIARASTFTYKGKAARLPDVGRELGVRYLLEGSVRKAAGRVRISVQLADATTGAELWAERYDRPLRDIFALQDEIVRRIVTTLNLEIALSQHGVLIPRSTDNLEAYDDVLRGWAYDLSWTKAGYLKARRMFEKAIELDSDYAYAYAGLGANYFIGYLSAFEPGRALERALQLEQQANALDDSLAPVHANLAVIYEFGGQYDQALAEARRAIALDPNYAFGYESLATEMNHRGKFSEGLAAAQTAARLDPRNTATIYGNRAGP